MYSSYSRDANKKDQVLVLVGHFPATSTSWSSRPRNKAERLFLCVQDEALPVRVSLRSSKASRAPALLSNLPALVALRELRLHPGTFSRICFSFGPLQKQRQPPLQSNCLVRCWESFAPLSEPVMCSSTEALCRCCLLSARSFTAPSVDFKNVNLHHVPRSFFRASKLLLTNLSTLMMALAELDNNEKKSGPCFLHPVGCS